MEIVTSNVSINLVNLQYFKSRLVNCVNLSQPLKHLSKVFCNGGILKKILSKFFLQIIVKACMKEFIFCNFAWF